MKILETKELRGQSRMTSKEIGKVSFDKNGLLEVQDGVAEEIVKMFSGRVWIQGEEVSEEDSKGVDISEIIEEKENPLKEDYDKAILEIKECKEKIKELEAEGVKLKATILEMEKEETLETKLQGKTIPQLKTIAEELGLSKDDLKGINKEAIIEKIIKETEK